MSNAALNLNELNARGEYADGWDYLTDKLKWLDLKIRLLLIRNRGQQSGEPYEQLRGLVVSESQVYQYFEDHEISAQDQAAIKQLAEQLTQLELIIGKRLNSSSKKNIFLPLPYISSVFRLTPFEEQCLIVCLAVEMDRKYEKLYAFLNDDVTCKNPTVDLIMKLLCVTAEERLAARLSFAPGGKLFRYFLNFGENAGGSSSLLSRALKLDERIIRFLINSEHIDDGIRSFCEVMLPGDELTPLLTGQETQLKIRNYSESDFNKIFYLHGPFGAGKKLQVKHYCHYVNRPLMLIDLLKAGEAEHAFKELMEKVVREAILHQAVLCLDNFHGLFEGERTSKNIKELFETLKFYFGTIFLLANTFKKPVEFNRDYYFIDIECKIPQDFERRRFWEYFGNKCNFNTEIDWGTLAGKFSFTPGQIRDAVLTAKNMAFRHAGDDRIEIEELYKACYAQVQHKLGEKASRLQPIYGWEDIVLPPDQKKQLQNACNQIRYRHIVYGEWGFGKKLSYGKGLCVLFSGPPGTGKTMSAQVVAKELILELYKIDLSQVVSKYIGETEKNLQQIFQEAQMSNAILFFDETDALFGKRSEVKDAHDRYANIETAYLLQKIEEYEGVTILATNFIQNIDEAFMRRFNFIINFPFPDTQYRKKIWESIFPKEAPLGDDLDFEFIAGKFEVAGGNIKNIAVSAAFLAAEAAEPIGMKHIITAAKHELHKIGKLLLQEDLGEYNGLINI